MVRFIIGFERITLCDLLYSSIISCKIFRKETKYKYLEIIKQLQQDGAEGVILGCTEIPLLITQKDCDITIFDTSFIHAKYAVKFALSEIIFKSI